MLGRRGQARLPASSPGSLSSSSLLPLSFSLPLTPPNFLFSPSPSQGVGCSLGIGEGVWVSHGQTFPIFYFTSHVFILMGIREKPHKQLAHQGFISWPLLLRVRQIGKRAQFWSVSREQGVMCMGAGWWETGQESLGERWRCLCFLETSAPNSA